MLQLIQVGDLVLLLAVVLLAAWFLAPWIVKIYKRAPSRIDRILDPIENSIYKICGVDPGHGMGWKEYFLAALFLNILQMAIAFVILVNQNVLPLNPMNFPGLSWHLALNTVVSFATNTNLQHYNGESSLSYLSQISAIQFLQFTSAATGICCGVAMVRGLVVHSTDLGNFFVDFVRSLTRLFIPLCFAGSIVFLALGVPQTLGGYVHVKTIEGAMQMILVGPVASLDSIMQFGTNGGGYYGANAAYPFMNPNPISDLAMIFMMLLIPTSLCFVFGRYIGMKRESTPIIFGAYSLFVINLFIAFVPNPVLVGPGLETRFGGFMSTFWTVVTTAVTTGSVNSSLLGNHPLAILSAFLGMFIQATPGGKGVGLMYLLMYVIITIFVVGLMSGRTPEYLGLKINARDVKLVMIAFLIHPLIIIFPTLIAYLGGFVSSDLGLSGNSLGFTQILYEFTTSAANNGSDFLGSSANTVFFNLSTAAVIFIGRYAPIACLLALAGSMIGRKRATTEAAIKTHSITFSLILVVSILILVVLTFFPFLALGPLLAFLRGHMFFYP